MVVCGVRKDAAYAGFQTTSLSVATAKCDQPLTLSRCCLPATADVFAKRKVTDSRLGDGRSRLEHKPGV